MSYDPAERRDTPLALRLKGRIRRDGPIAIDDYVHACLLDPEFGYYRKGRVVGRDGDFITAPEISQVFGELLGLWCVAVWQQMGRPVPLNLIELGAGSGTMLADALRAARVRPAMLQALHVFIIEAHPELRRRQRVKLETCPVRITWPERLSGVGDGAAILLANEFLDCLPIAQFIYSAGWRRRIVDVDENDQLQITFADDAKKDAEQSVASELRVRANTRAKSGDIAEIRRIAGSEIGDLQSFVFGIQPARAFAALFIDYGHKVTAFGDTLQAVRGHRYEHPLTSPGEADLTSQVDFAQFAYQMREEGFAVDGPVTQSEFLGRLGVAERTSILMASNTGEAHALEQATARLMSPNGMGNRYKAIAIRHPALAPLPGLETLDNLHPGA